MGRLRLPSVTALGSKAGGTGHGAGAAAPDESSLSLESPSQLRGLPAAAHVSPHDNLFSFDDTTWKSLSKQALDAYDNIH